MKGKLTSFDQSTRNGRVGLPTSGVPGSLFDFVRRFLVAHEGRSTRQELLTALQADEIMSPRLAASQGFIALLNNMRHSGDLLLDGDTITATRRTWRRLDASTA